MMSGTQAVFESDMQGHLIMLRLPDQFKEEGKINFLIYS